MRILFCLLGGMLLLNAGGASPFESEKISLSPNSEINRILKQGWKEHMLPEAKRCSDAVFLRRACLTVAGRLPDLEEARAFLKDTSKDKRSRLIDRLLASEEFADLLTMRFADMLRIKSEFPINLWPNAVQLWHRRIRSDLLAGRSYRDMAREMLTASGSNFRVPHANFFRASADRSPEGLAKIAAQTFLGIRLEDLSPEQRKEFAAFFSRIRYKSTDEWKEEILFCDPVPAIVNACTINGEHFTIRSPEQDPRTVFADWLLKEDNPYFARAAVNRAWFWIFGRGILADPDRMPLVPGFWDRVTGWIGGNAAEAEEPFQRELLALLEKEFRASRYNFRELYRVILNSDAFQASSIGPETSAERFAVYPVRRLEAEILVDALASVSDGYDSYMSVIPEPFTFLPKKTRTVTIADGSISTGVLDYFGRPPRDSGLLKERNNAVTEAQRLYLMNSGTLYGRLSALPWKLFKNKKLNDDQRMEELYLFLLSRYPTAEERKKIYEYQRSFAPRERYRVWPDLAWVLVNSKEFLYYH